MHTFIESELLGTAVVNLPVAADEGKGWIAVFTARKAVEPSDAPYGSAAVPL